MLCKDDCTNGWNQKGFRDVEACTKEANLPQQGVSKDDGVLGRVASRSSVPLG